QQYADADCDECSEVQRVPGWLAWPVATHRVQMNLRNGLQREHRLAAGGLGNGSKGESIQCILHFCDSRSRTQLHIGVKTSLRPLLFARLPTQQVAQGHGSKGSAAEMTVDGQILDDRGDA